LKSYLLKRLLLTIPAIFGVVSIVFLLIHLIPGDPVDMLLGDMAQDVDKSALRKSMNLDIPLWDQYLMFWKNIFFGGWGKSFTHDQNVLSLILEKFPSSCLLAVSSLTIAVGLSFPLGILAARKSGTIIDTGAMLIALIGMSVPVFVMGPIATFIFSIELQWFPISGAETMSHLVLPSVCMGFGISGILTRMVRTSMLECLGEDFIRTARAKGLKEFWVLWKHTFRNALIPVVTILGNVFGSLLAGAVITETIFDWPGIGDLFFKSIEARDTPLIQGIVLWISLTYVIINFIIDIMYSWIDPRIRVQG